jgi:Tol biopolymer transport system component
VSRDGSTVAYTRLELDDRGGVTQARPMLFSAAGGQRSLAALPAGLAFFPYGWTPDGRELLGSMVRTPDGQHVRLAAWPIDAATDGGAGRVLVSEANASIWQGRVSPDGRWLTFVVLREARPGHVEIVVAPFERPTPDRWIRAAAEHEWADKPRWAPDGRTLYFLSRRPNTNFDLWGIRFDPAEGRLLGEPFAVTNIDSPALVIAPDMSNTEMQVAERHAVLIMQTTTGNIWTIANVDR